MKKKALPLFIISGFLALSAPGLTSDLLRLEHVTSTTAAAADVWPGWRGGGAQGKSAQPLPLEWNADTHIRWKVPIPGRGHSSPIVYGDRVYVTTAEVTVVGVWVDRALRGLTLGLVFATAALLLHVVAGRCDPAHSHASPAWAASILMVAVVVALIVIACCGDALFDVARSPMRAWIVSAVFCSLCLAVNIVSADQMSSRLGLVWGAMIFAGFVLAAFPLQAYAFRAGLYSLRTQIVIAASAIPLMVGLTAALVTVRKPRVRRLVGGMFVLSIGVGLVLLAYQLLSFQDDSIPDLPYLPRLSRWLLALPAAWLAAVACRSVLPRSLRTHLSVIVGGAISIVVLGAIAVESLAVRSPYLAYQIGAPRFEPLTDGTVLGIASAGLLVHLWWMTGRSTASRRIRPNRCLTTVLALSSGAVGALFFFRVNYVHPHRSMDRAIVSLDRWSGQVRWVLRGLEGPQSPTDGRNSPATPTPVTDGRNICGYFGTAGLLCAKTDGQLAWSRRDLTYDGIYGVGFSPVLVEGKVILVRDMPNGRAVIQALDLRSGQTLWTREFVTTPTFSGNNRTPIIRQVDGETMLIVWGMEYVTAFSIRSGDPIWHYPFTSGGDLVGSAIADADRLYLATAGGTVALDEADLIAGRDPVRWRSRASANCVSPVVANGLIFTITDAGIAAAIRASNGEVVWRHRLPGEYFASLLASSNAVYFTNRDGLTTVVAAEPTFRMLGQNALDQETMASMATVGRELFIRSGNAVYAVDEQ